MKPIVLAILTLTYACAAAIEISGRVLDPEGNPVPDADVWLSRERAVTATKSGENGGFTFPNILPGILAITARKPEFALTGLSGYVFDNLNADLHMALPDTVRLRVIDHAGNPVEGARVKRLVINNAFEIFASDLAQHGFPSIRSDADGAIAILGVPQGSQVAVTLEHRRFCDLYLPYLVPHPNQHPAQLYPGEVLRGYITTPENTGLSNARVLVFRKDGEERLLMYDVLADAEGYYRAIVSPGTYSLQVHHAEYPTPMPQEVSISDGMGEVIIDIAVPSSHAIEGTVIGPEGNPMPGVAVTYIVNDFVQDEAYTDGTGTYRLTVAPGEGRVHVIPPPGYMTAGPLDVVVRIEKVPHTRVSAIPLKKLPSLRGKVVSDDNAPQENVLIRTRNLKTPLYALTDSEGAFEIPLDVMPEEKAVKMRAEHTLRFLRRDFEIVLREHEKTVTVRLRPFNPDVAPNDPQKAPNDLSRLVDKPAPPLECSAWVNSDPVSLEDLRGKVVVLLLWAGFDPYARNQATLSELILLHRALAHSADDVAFIGVHDDSDPPDAVRNYLAELGLEFPTGVDAPRLLTHNRYDARVLPQVILIDKKGIVRYFDVEGRLPELLKDLRRRP